MISSILDSVATILLPTSLSENCHFEPKARNLARSDLVRIYDFLAPVNKSAAARTVQSLTTAPIRLLEHPRIGEKLEEFDPREVRRILAGHYEMRYEIQESTIYVLRLWHTREDR